MKFVMRTTNEYERLVQFFVKNGLEFDGDEEVDTDIIKCWKISQAVQADLTRIKDAHADGTDALVAGCVLALREGRYIIDGIAVDPVLRKEGLGKLLVDKVKQEVQARGGDAIYLVARAPGFFRRLGFETIDPQNAPNFFECKQCPQYQVSCHPEVMRPAADYSRLLQAILDIAEEMLVAGAEVSRVEDSVERMCGAYGCDRINVFVITSNIQVTMEAPDGEILTQIRRIIRNDVNFDRLDYLNDLSRYICAETPSLAQLNEKFDGVMNRKIYSVWMKYVSAIFIAGGFAVFFGGQLLDGAASALVGIAVIWLLNALSKRDHNLLATNFVVSFAAGLLSITLVHFGIGIHVDKIMIGAIMIQIPGIAMTNAVRDMLTGDLATGLLRLVTSLLLAAVIACGFALSILVTGGGIL